LGSPTAPALQLAKTLHTERHRRLRELLVERRKAAGLTQTVLAARLGKPPSYVAKYELGERRLDVLEYLDIAAAIGFDPREPLGALLKE
jgi:transcriptional regulator with XRE-family HTH domain